MHRQHDAHDGPEAPRDDGDVCTVADACAGGACVAGAALGCGDGNPCTDDSCAKADPANPGKPGGCTNTPNVVGCDDGNLCTVGDACNGGVCLPGATTPCDDGNPCTNDSCDPSAKAGASTGCVHVANALPCGDGDPCTGGDACSGGACKSGAIVNCDDGNPCTDDSCDPSGKAPGNTSGKPGCVHQANAATCSDGNACTVDDACIGGSCKPGAAKPCDDGNACTTDSSDPSNCGSCGKVCDPGALCLAGSCTPIVCVPSGKTSCYSGPSGTLGVGACSAGEKTCNSTGTAWLPGCKGEVLPASVESCETQADDDCDGKANPASICGPAEYIFSQAPDCGSYCYYDEPHNLAVSGNKADNSKVGTYSVGQLVDGVKGHDAWNDDLGKGPAYEWVGFVQGKPELTFRLPKVTDLTKVVVGLCNTIYGGVNQPTVIEVETSVDGSTWSAKTTFSQGDGTMAKIASGKRGDVVLALGKVSGRYIRLTITRNSWAFIDEVAFE